MLGYIIFFVNRFIIFHVLSLNKHSYARFYLSDTTIFNLFLIGLIYQPRVASSQPNFLKQAILLLFKDRTGMNSNLSSGFLLHWIVSLAVQVLFHFMRSQLSVVLNFWANGVLFRKFFPTHIVWGIT